MLKNCLEKIVTYNVSSISFFCLTTCINGFDQRKAVEMALLPVKIWLESYRSFVNFIIICTHKKEDY